MLKTVHICEGPTVWILQISIKNHLQWKFVRYSAQSKFINWCPRFDFNGHF